MSYFIAKMHQIRFRLRHRPDPLLELKSAPQAPYIQLYGGLGVLCKLPGLVWDGAAAEIEFGAF